MKLYIIMGPILATIIGIALNFQAMLMGSPATLQNVIVTCIYIFVWGIAIAKVIRSQQHTLKKYYTLFWGLTFIFAVLTVIANATTLKVEWIIPFITIFLTPWYGIQVLTYDYFTTTLIIAAVSTIILFIFRLLPFNKH